MTINEYFKEYDNKYFEMKDKLIEIKEARSNFYNLTGSKFSDIPKSGFSTADFADQISRINDLIEDYKKKEKNYIAERDKCLVDINKLKKPMDKTIIKLAFLEKKKNKSISSILNKIYNLDYSTDYIKNLKGKAIHNFEQIVTKCYEMLPNVTNCS